MNQLSILRKIFLHRRKKLVNFSDKNNKLTAILYYKIPRFPLSKHANNRMIIVLIQTLIEYGYNVLLIDRSCTSPAKPAQGDFHNCNLFIGIDGVRSGKNFQILHNIFQPQVTSLLMTTQSPGVFFNDLKARQDLFTRSNKRFKLANIYRTVSRSELMSFNHLLPTIDHILAPSLVLNRLQEDSMFNFDKISKSRIEWSTLPEITYIKRSFNQEPKFLMVCGNDAILKGIDIAVDVFSLLPFQLNICSPDCRSVNEILAYNENPPNIVNHGFVSLSSQEGFDLLKDCTFFIDLSATDGTSTSLLNCLKTGLIPIVLEKNLPRHFESVGLKISETLLESPHNIAFLISDYIKSQSREELSRLSRQISKTCYINHTENTFACYFSNWISQKIL